MPPSSSRSHDTRFAVHGAGGRYHSGIVAGAERGGASLSRSGVEPHDRQHRDKVMNDDTRRTIRRYAAGEIFVMEAARFLARDAKARRPWAAPAREFISQSILRDRRLFNTPSHPPSVYRSPRFGRRQPRPAKRRSTPLKAAATANRANAGIECAPVFFMIAAR